MRTEVHRVHLLSVLNCIFLSHKARLDITFTNIDKEPFEPHTVSRNNMKALTSNVIKEKFNIHSRLILYLIALHCEEHCVAWW